MQLILKSRCDRGFTLIEILIVLAIIAGITAYTLPRLSTGDRIKSSLRKMSVLMKQAQNEARLKNKIYRMAFEIPNDPKKAHVYWLEVATSDNVKLVFEEGLPDPEALKGIEEEEKPPEPFVMDSRLTKSRIELPENFFFEGIEFQDKTTEEGKAFIYFFPQGLVTKAIIHLSNRDKINYSLIINPLTGQTTIMNEKKTFKDIQ